MIVEFFIYVAVCRLFIYLGQKFPLIIYLGNKSKLLSELFSCDLCFGVWVAFGLAFIFQINFFDGWFYIIGISEFMTGAVTSFILFLLKLGWETGFSEIVVN